MNAKQTISTIYALIKYSLKIIFAGKFFWFILSAFAFFSFLMVINVVNDLELSEFKLMWMLFFPGVLLVFYPSVFGIQNDDDSRILEILFGIPNYRYKVWLLRLVMIYVAVGLILLIFAIIGSVLLYPINPLLITVRLMFPIVFIGNLAFMLSTAIRNGNGTAVVLVVLILAMMLLIENDVMGVKNSFWNVMLNPYRIPDDVHPLIWQATLVKNIIFLVVGSTLFLLFGLLNLQKREKFV